MAKELNYDNSDYYAYEKPPSAPYYDDSDEPDYGKRTKIGRSMRIAVTGCSHGEMDKIYETIAAEEQKRRVKIDLLICCGDFQAVRNYNDLQHVNVPPKYRQLMTFHKYYSGEKVAPVLTIFIGGNHESSGFMAELPNGGWAAPNIYYMGYASVVRVGGLRIAGLSGIFKANDYDRGHFERPPFNEQTLRSIYHVRSVDVFRLKQLKTDDGSKMDMVISHDWPAGITDFGDVDALLRIKPYFRNDIDNNQLGNPATMDLLHELKPRRWCSAHMHVRFEAEVNHHDKHGSITKFLALDKPLPRRKFLEFFEVPLTEEQQAIVDEDDGQFYLYHDPEWLAILKNTDFLTEVTDKRVYMPGRTSSATERFDFRPTKAELDHVRALFDNEFKILHNFRQTAPPLNVAKAVPAHKQSLYYRNPSSTEFCEKLGIRDLNHLLCLKTPQFVGIPHYCESSEVARLSRRHVELALSRALATAPSLDQFPQVAPRLTPALREIHSSSTAGTSTANNPDEIDICAALDEENEDESEAAGDASSPVQDDVNHHSRSNLAVPVIKSEYESNELFVVDPMPQNKKSTVL